MANIIETLKQNFNKRRQQARLEIIQGELEQAQRDCAALGAYIGSLIKRKSELEIEIARNES